MDAIVYTMKFFSSEYITNLNSKKKKTGNEEKGTTKKGLAVNKHATIYVKLDLKINFKFYNRQ